MKLEFFYYLYILSFKYTDNVKNNFYSCIKSNIKKKRYASKASSFNYDLIGFC